MAVFQGVFFLLLGAGLLFVIWRALSTGFLPCGSKGLKGRLEFSRSGEPFGYWLMFALYGVGAIWLIIFSLRLLAGHAEALPLR